jgi:hypothetical protein
MQFAVQVERRSACTILLQGIRNRTLLIFVLAKRQECVVPQTRYVAAINALPVCACDQLVPDFVLRMCEDQPTLSLMLSCLLYVGGSFFRALGESALFWRAAVYWSITRDDWHSVLISSYW